MSGATALEHPLPEGMRDLLPGEASRQADLTGSVVDVFELHGYERVALPVFEYADVLERGLGTVGLQGVLRFFEPETGEVLALRSDVTPQIARLVATRLASEPVPARLAYEGMVLRKRHERARSNRQVGQAGIELIGTGGAEGDEEVLTIASNAVRAAGLDGFVMDLAHAQVPASLLESVDRSLWPPLIESLGLKDGAELERRARAANVPSREREALVALVDLHGGAEVWPRADAALRGTAAAGPANELRQRYEFAVSAGLAANVVVDLGETWNFAYYTGLTFQILADGPGEPVGSGGRYDGLLERFGASRPAAGFALDLDNLGWALARARGGAKAPPKVLVRTTDATSVAPILQALRAQKIRCAAAPTGDAVVYSRSWSYSHIFEVSAAGGSLVRLEDNARVRIEGGAVDDLAVKVAQHARADAEPRA